MNNKGMIRKCVGCGYSKHISLEGTAEEIEARCHETITVEGWRYAPEHDGFVCGSCAKNGSPDKLYELFTGKIKKANKVNSYKALMLDMCRQLEAFKELDSLTG